ncbi:N-formylglutamate amidohydrolase [Kiloniella sp.]|uniref:N-formylglutamate amidohydrolase n=1 Tax=Kiloniella sp. TaxID=1938587 RepID=UPI003B02C714
MSSKLTKSADESSADGVVKTTNLSGDGEFVIVCEHASNYIPPKYDNLGLQEDELKKHIAWDPGALAVAQTMSKLLNAPLVEQCVSRLIYDCNRPPEAHNAMPVQSEIFEIPGNKNLSQEERDERIASVYTPFKNAVSSCIDQKLAEGRNPVVITVHSFTPTYKGEKRDVEIGFLHDEDERFAKGLIKSFALETDIYDLRLNEPYAPIDGVTHTLTEHALSRGLMNVMLEIRNDLISDKASQLKMANQLSQAALEARAVLVKENSSSSSANQTITRN